MALNGQCASRPVVRLALVLATVLALPACEKTVQTPAEVAQRVLENSAWVEDARACPADVMATEEPSSLHLPLDQCKGKAIGQCLTFCGMDQIDACYWLAQELLTQKQEQASEIVFQRACILGDASGCTNRGAFLKVAKGNDPKFQSCTTRTFHRACEAKDPWGCTMYGHAFRYGLGVAPDEVRARHFFEMGCELSDSSDHPACEAARQAIGEMDAARNEVAAGAGS